MNDLSDSEIQKLREDIAAAEKRRWLWRIVRTGAAWAAGVTIATAATVRSIKDMLDWVSGK